MMILIVLLACSGDVDDVTKDTVSDVSFTIGGVSVRENPNNELSFFVSWKTNERASSTISFGEGELQWTLSEPALTTEHEMFVYGVHAEAVITVEIQSTNEAGDVVVEALEHTTKALPEHVPVAEVLALREGKQPGWTLLNTNNKNADWPGAAIVYDEKGLPVWYHVSNTMVSEERGDMDVSLTADNTIMIGGSRLEIDPVEVDLTGEVVWYGPDNVVGDIQHHHFRREPDGTTVMTKYAVKRPVEYPGTTIDRIEQVDLDLNIVWSWDGYDHFDLPAGGDLGDWCHANSVTMREDFAYLNCRTQSKIYKINKATGDIEWELGRNGDFELVNNRWFTHEHEPQLQDDGSWLIYDNDGKAPHTRIIRMVIDETTKEAEVVWEFPGPFEVPVWYTEQWGSSIWGDVDKLENGNILVCAASRDFGDSTRIFEVNMDGEILWSIELPFTPNSELVVGSYRAQRVDWLGLTPYAE